MENQTTDQYVNGLIGPILSTKNQSGETDIKKVLELLHMAHQLEKQRIINKYEEKLEKYEAKLEEYESKLKQAQESNTQQYWRDNRRTGQHQTWNERVNRPWSSRPNYRGGYKHPRGSSSSENNYYHRVNNDDNKETSPKDEETVTYDD